MHDQTAQFAVLIVLARATRALSVIEALVGKVESLQEDELGLQVPSDALNQWTTQLDEGSLSLKTAIDLASQSQSIPDSVASFGVQCRSLTCHVKTRVSQTLVAATGTIGHWPPEDLRMLAIKIRDLSEELQRAIASSVCQSINLEALLDSTEAKQMSTDEKECTERILNRQLLLNTNLGVVSKSDSKYENTHESGRSNYTVESEQVLHEQAASDKGELLQEFILENLRFGSMNDREDEIATAHKKTFDWAFTRQLSSPNTPTLQEWMQSSDTMLFWITGKPGSGKSTLMRYLSTHSTTFDALRRWAGENGVTFASFYFWISGSLEQRSQTGLLRHILHQLLSQHPRLVPLAFPSLWQRCWAASTRERLQMLFSWDVDDLVEGLKRFLRFSTTSGKIAIFIDGLDEFDGSHEYIVGLLSDLLALAQGRLKLLVSSREWDVFERAFADVAKLRLQDLTASDLSRYIDDHLFQQGQLMELAGMTKNACEKVQLELLSKAGGVFLWVRLAVTFLLDRVTDLKSNIAFIHEHVGRLPTDLDRLFDFLLFETRDLEQVNQAYQVFEILRAREEACLATGDESVQSPLLWELTLAHTATCDRVLQTEIAKLPRDDMVSACQQTRQMLKDSCAGLIEAHGKRQSRESRTPLTVGKNPSDNLHQLGEGKVTYLHRTVKDYLASEEFGALIRSKANTGAFDPHLLNLIACIMRLKLPLETPKKHRRLDERWTIIVLAMTHARLSYSQSNEMMISLVDDLNDTMSHLWETRRDDESDTWAWACFSSFEQRAKMLFDDSWLSLVAKFGLTRYMEARLRHLGAIPAKGGWPVLHYAVEYLFSRQNSMYPLSSPELVQLLLSYGADPNKSYGKAQTAWKCVLDSMRQANRRQWIYHYDTAADGSSRWFEILRILLEHGANPNAFLASTHKDPAVTALELSDMVLQRYGLSQTEAFRRLLLEKGANLDRKGEQLDAAEKTAAEAAKAAQKAEHESEQESQSHLATLAGPDVGRRPVRPSRIKRQVVASYFQDDNEQEG